MDASTSNRTALTPWYYRLALQLAQPFYRLALWRRRQHTYPTQLEQRFAKQLPQIAPANSAIIWIHAVSVGETNAAAGVIDKLLADGYQVWITNTTETGYQRSQHLFRHAITAHQVYVSFVPVDTASVMARFIAHVQPQAALLIEKELWANMLAQLQSRGATTILVNGQLSEQSFKGYQRLEQVFYPVIQNLDLIIAQNVDTAARYRRLGVERQRIRIAPPLKWSVTDTSDTQALQHIQTQWDIANRPLIVAASTHEGEETFILTAYQQLLNQTTIAQLSPILVIIPRHPERFEEVAEIIAASQQVYRRSQDDNIDKECQVYLVDTMGEVMLWYRLASIAIVGGSLTEGIGGHNPIEPAVCALPIVMGTDTQSCQTVVDALEEAGGLVCVNTQAALTQQLGTWLLHPERATQAGQRAKQVVETHNDALEQQYTMIKECLITHRSQKIDVAIGHYHVD